MTTQRQQDEEARVRERAWELLESAKDHPQVQLWLEEAAAAPPPRQSLRTWSIAAALVLAIGVGLATYVFYSRTHYQTRIGEQRDVMLPDGSKVTLNTDTELTVRYSDDRRYIVLERGEALFDVKHNVSRPFDVAAGDTLTRALGTEFNVDMRRAKVTVSVLEGAVRVAAANVAGETVAGARASDELNAMTPVAALAKGQALEFHRNDGRVLEERADLRRIDAWRTRRLEFSDTPLGEAVEEFNRYSMTPLVIGTPALSDVRVSGAFRIGDTDGFLFSLREALHVETHESKDEIVLMAGVHPG